MDLLLLIVQLNYRPNRSTKFGFCLGNATTVYCGIGTRWTYPDAHYFCSGKLEFLK